MGSDGVLGSTSLRHASFSARPLTPQCKEIFSMKKLLSLAALAWSALFAVNIAVAEPKPGDPAPDFSLVGSDGKTYKLSDFKGKSAVVIAWFPKAFTGGCTTECKNMRAEGDKIKAYNVAYFTASVDDAKLNADFAKSLDLDFPILSDPTRSTAETYGLLKAPGGVTNRYTVYVGKDGKLLEIDKAITPASSAADIAAKLEKYGVEKK
jgi:peroxiredoxin Q/BCP